MARTPSPITCTKATSEVGWSGGCGRGITVHYSSANNSLPPPPPNPQAASPTYAGGSGEEGVRGVTLAPGCANSRRVTFYR